MINFFDMDITPSGCANNLVFSLLYHRICAETTNEMGKWINSTQFKWVLKSSWLLRKRGLYYIVMKLFERKAVYIMSEKHGSLSINSDNIFPIIKKWLYSDHDIFFRELISNGCDATHPSYPASSVLWSHHIHWKPTHVRKYRDRNIPIF